MDDKRTHILLAATQLMKSSGLQALSFEAVATQAGLSRQLVRYYFADLDTLVIAVCDHLAARYRTLLISGIVDINEVERLRFFLDFFFDLADGHPMPDDLEVYDSFLAYAVGTPALKDRLCDQYKTLGQVVVHELAIAHPELTDAACEELSFIFVSMMHAHWSFVATLGHTRDHSRLTRNAIDRLIASYIETPPGAPLVAKVWARDP